MVDTVDTKTFHKDGLTNTNSLLCHFAIQRMLSIVSFWISFPDISIIGMPGRAEWKTSKSEMLKFSGRLWTTSPSWYQNSFWNHDQTILLLRNWANVNYVTQKIRKFMNHIKLKNVKIFGQIINHVTVLISKQFSESWSDNLCFVKLSKRELQDAKN